MDVIKLFKGKNGNSSRILYDVTQYFYFKLAVLKSPKISKNCKKEKFLIPT